MDNGATKSTEREITDQLTEELKLLASEAEELLKTKSSKLAGKTREIRDHLASVLETAELTVETLESRTAAGVKAADRIIRDHPYPALGMALGIGLALGLLLKRD